MEPRTSTPEQRLKTVEFLSGNGILTGVNVAPIIPGLTDEEIPSILKAASEHGAKFAGRVVLRLPHSTKELFTEWLEREMPEKSKKILNRIKELHGGKLYDSEFGKRLSGTGKWAETIQGIFNFNCRKYKLNEAEFHLSKNHFRRNVPGQNSLFD